MPRPPGPPAREPAAGGAPRQRSAPRGGGRVGGLLLGVTTVLAVAGAVTLALTEDARWLRLGIVAALWAALAGAFAAARHRRDAIGPTRAGERLDREVASGREHELHAAADTRRRLAAEVRAEVRGELDGLRAELQALRQTLEGLLGGELMVERVALRAESTRLRPLAEQPRPVARELPQAAGPHSGQRPTPAADRAAARPEAGSRAGARAGTVGQAGAQPGSGSRSAQRPAPATQAAAPQRGQQPRPAQRQPEPATGRYQPPPPPARPAAPSSLTGSNAPASTTANASPGQRSPAAAGPAAHSWPGRPWPGTSPQGPSWPGAAPAAPQRLQNAAPAVPQRLPDAAPAAPPSWPRHAEPADAPGRRRRREDEPLPGHHQPAGRRHAEDDGAHAAGHPVHEPPAAREGGSPAPSRHRRGDG